MGLPHTLLCMLIPSAIKPRIPSLCPYSLSLSLSLPSSILTHTHRPINTFSLCFLSVKQISSILYFLFQEVRLSIFPTPLFSFSCVKVSSNMSGASADRHKLLLSHHLFNKKTIDIPPRKLLSRQANLEASDIFSDSPKALSAAGETLFQKFLPFNGSDDDDSDPYSSDHFRMFEFKVRRCTRCRSHDWTDCPFAHPGEKARRRDPRRYHYSGTVCSEYRRGGCSKGDSCEFAHGVFECWLHPARYRTEACKDGKNCKRKVCFFAHSRKQLRVLPLHSQNSSTPDVKFSPLHHCCLFCHPATSPTSTLMGMSHFTPPESPSPPLSPVNPAYSPISRYIDRSASLDSTTASQLRHAMLSCNKDVVAELMSYVEAMNLNEASAENTNSWVDACFSDEDHQQFVLSPSTPKASGSRHFFIGNWSGKSFTEDKVENENGSWNCPDLGWVNDLLM